MKKVFSSKTLLNFGLFVFVEMLIFVVLALTLFATQFGQSNFYQKVLYGVLIGTSIVFTLAYSFLFNRIGCIVWFDEKADTICRRGFFFGFNYCLKRSQIKDIVVATIPKQTKFFVIVDESNHSFEGLSKRSYIRLEYNPKNRVFIQKIWNKPLQ